MSIDETVAAIVVGKSGREIKAQAGQDQLNTLLGHEVRIWSSDRVIHLDGPLTAYGEGYRVLVWDGKRVSSALFWANQIDWNDVNMDNDVTCLRLKGD